MRITYVSQARFPTEKAHGHQIAAVCAAMVRLGHTVTVVAPGVHNTVQTEAQHYYGHAEKFSVERLSIFDALRAWWIPGFLAFAVTMRLYSSALRRHLSAHRADLLYTRSPALLPALLSSGIPVILELHTLPRGGAAFMRRCNACRLAVCLTRPMRDALVQRGADPAHIVVEGDGVDPQRFRDLPFPSLTRARWGLPAERKVVGYVGSLVTRDRIDKGVGLLVEALAILKQRGMNVFGWIVGGPQEYAEREEKHAHSLSLTAGDIRFQGPLPAASVPSVLAACDVCVYPAPESGHPYFVRDTSPMKVFEYLASGRPIVCADIPSFRGVIDPALVHLCPPGNAVALADAIAEAVHNPRSSNHHRHELLTHVCWESRMERILARARA